MVVSIALSIALREGEAFKVIRVLPGPVEDAA
jgi:hypothetical protein